MLPKLTQMGFNCWTDPEDRTKPHPKSKGNPLLLNPNIRRAFDYAMDKEKLVQIVLGNVGVVGTSLVPTASGKWHLDVPHEYNPEKAIELLEKEGFTKFEEVEVNNRKVKVRANEQGEKLVFRMALLTSGYAGHYRDSMPFITKWLETVGIGLQIETMDGDALGERSTLDSQNVGDFDVYIWGWTPDYEPAYMLSVLTTEQIGGRSDCLYSNPNMMNYMNSSSTRSMKKNGCKPSIRCRKWCCRKPHIFPVLPGRSGKPSAPTNLKVL